MEHFATLAGWDWAPFGGPGRWPTVEGEKKKELSRLGVVRGPLQRGKSRAGWPAAELGWFVDWDVADPLDCQLL